MQAAGVAQDYLDRIARAVIAGDWMVYRRGVALPFHMVTAAADILVGSEEKLRQGYDTFRDFIMTSRITDMIRLVGQADYIDDCLITATYVTHLVSGGQRVVPPYVSQISLRRDAEGEWQALSITNGLDAGRWPVLSVQISKDKPT